MSRELVRSVGTEALVEAAARHVGRLFESEVAVFCPDPAGELRVLFRTTPDVDIGAKQTGVAQWVWANGREAGVSTHTLPGASGLYLPLKTAERNLGVLGIFAKDRDRFDDPGERRLLDAFATQMAAALERARLAEEAQRVRVESERERLRSALLSSVSHDLRTPLAAIEGAATTLLDRQASLDDAVRRDLLDTIREEAERLNRRVRNLLDMTRLDAGAVAVSKEWQPLEEVVGAALTQLEDRLAGREVRTQLGDRLQLVPLDAVLIEQVLVNLLENALKYSAGQGPLEIRASAGEREVVVEVADHGPGLPPGEEERIFERFHRAAGHGGPGGVGLGLAICRAIVAAHGGRIWAENRSGGGAAFKFTLPLEGEAPDSEAERPASASEGRDDERY
jgi:two-component system sensor histidine kinase KdpD